MQKYDSLPPLCDLRQIRVLAFCPSPFAAPRPLADLPVSMFDVPKDWSNVFGCIGAAVERSCDLGRPLSIGWPEKKWPAANVFRDQAISRGYLPNEILLIPFDFCHVRVGKRVVTDAVSQVNQFPHCVGLVFDKPSDKEESRANLYLREKPGDVDRVPPRPIIVSEGDGAIGSI